MPKPRRQRQGDTLSVRKLSSGGWVFVHPRAVRDRMEDLQEVQAMVQAGEADIAIDELRWLLGGCSEFIAAHALLGELSIDTHADVPLARGHFGFAYQLGQKALRRNRCRGPLPGRQPANEPFYQAARGLAYCLEELGKRKMASEIADEVRKLDPEDPLGVAALLDELRSGGAPVVDLTPPGE